MRTIYIITVFFFGVSKEILMLLKNVRRHFITELIVCSSIKSFFSDFKLLEASQ